MQDLARVKPDYISVTSFELDSGCRYNNAANQECQSNHKLNDEKIGYR